MELGLPEFHCKWNYMHIKFTPEEMEQHQAQCTLNVENTEKVRMKLQKEINQNIELGDKAPETNELFQAYRESQGEDCRGDKRNLEQVEDSDLSDVSEGEIGSENFERYLKMTPSDQIKARKRFKELKSTLDTDDSHRHNSEDASVSNFLDADQDGSNLWFQVLKLVALLTSFFIVVGLTIPSQRKVSLEQPLEV